jgi:hypothetical protein
MRFFLHLFVAFSLLLAPVNAVGRAEELEVNLDLLEVVLEPLSRGGSASYVSRVTRAIVAGTRGAHRSIQEIAALRVGTRYGDFERSLHRWSMRQPWYSFLPKPFEFKLFKDTRHGPQELSHFAVLPHELFSSVYHQAEDLFELLFTGPEGNLDAWWAAAAAEGGDWLKLHPVVALQPDSSKRVPFGIHGDDAGAQGHQSIRMIIYTHMYVRTEGYKTCTEMYQHVEHAKHSCQISCQKRGLPLQGIPRGDV